MRKTKWSVLLIALVLPFLGQAQESDFGNWLIYIGSKKLSSKFNLHHEAQYRNYNAVGDLEQMLLRTGIGYNLSENNNNVLFGYAFIHSQNYVGDNDFKTNTDEHRLFQQFITFQSLGRVKLQHRYRFEQRWVDDSDFKLRFRYFLSMNIPLNNPDMVDGTLYYSMYNEIFINNVQTLFDRNRLYAGVGYRISKHVRVELAYMNQFLNNANRDQLNIMTLANF